MTVLDPNNIVLSSGATLINDQIAYLPSSIYDFGHLPDKSKLLPGDLILFSQVKPDFGSKAIIRTQGLLFASGCEWTHAAIYIGDWTLVEANPWKGIHKGLLFRYVPGYKISVRRLSKIDVEEPSKARMMGLELALDSTLRMPNSWYPTKWLLAFLVNCFEKPNAKFNINRNIRFANHHVCSSLYATCAFETHGVNVAGNDLLSRSLNICPAMLRYSKEMVDVDIGWSKLEKPSR